MTAHSSKRGMALLLVLGCLVFVSALTIAFLGTSRVEYASSRSYASGVTLRQLADSCVNLVMIQIKDATKGVSAGKDNLAWASQPGMIRTFDSSGALVKAYKLYSSGSMIETGQFAPAKEASELKGWEQSPAIFTDLNEPSRSYDNGKNQSVHYPILDPRAIDTNSTAGVVSEGGVDQFNISPDAPLTSSQAAPMPVRWLYILQDGQIVVPGGSGKFATVEGASRQNPITARIAFWSDDETCKVNLNTASEGIYWDTPRMTTDFDRSFLAKYQPAQHEWNRYPGHPATVSLSAVLGSFFPLTPLSANTPYFQSSDYEKFKFYYNLTPGISYKNSSGNDTGSQGGTAIAKDMLQMDNDRPYPSVDEMIFGIPNTPKSSTNTRSPSNSRITPAILNSTRFFLTTHSRSPEVNLFNKPRVTIWPIHKINSPIYRTTFDQAVAFCSRIGNYDYFFQRELADSPTNDYNNIARNQQLYSYLQTLMSSNIPGFGGNFKSKYSADSNQILTEIFDYIRCTNLFDESLEGKSMTYPTTKGQFTNKRLTPTDVEAGFGQVAPIRINDTKGFGRFPTVSEPTLLFIRNATKPASGPDDKVQVVLLLKTFNPSQGYCAIRHSLRIKISGLNNLRLNGNALTFPNDGTYWGKKYMASSYNGRLLGGLQDVRAFVDRNYPYYSNPLIVTGAANLQLSQVDDITVKLYVEPNPANATGTSAGNEDYLVQTLKFKFPNTTFPLPTQPPLGYETFIGKRDQSGTYDPTTGAPVAGNGGWYCDAQYSAMIQKNDCIRSLTTPHGDYRLLAGLFDVDNSKFDKATSRYNTAAVAMTGLLRMDKGLRFLKLDGDPFQSDIANGKATLVTSNQNQSDEFRPDVPENAKTFCVRTGDYDTGIGKTMDGPYINKPDEGNIYGQDTGEVPYIDTDFIQQGGGNTYFSPNRIIPSAGMFGSLPTGVKAGVPWQTLLFRPQPDHPGAVSPKDHLILDLFQMPVVEPYAISQPLSSEGKINMNYQIVPFTYIHRSTGMRAALKAEMMTAIKSDGQQMNLYKNNLVKPNNFRFTLNLEEKDGTLRQFKEKFDSGDIFRSASEICDIYLVPSTESWTSDNQALSYWAARKMTGENLRERPYTTIYPKLTTKSNTYQVHFRVQTLKKRKMDKDQSTWKENEDAVTGEYRGSTLIERYIDPNQTDLPDYATDASSKSLDSFYRFNIIYTKSFNP
ncbi:MAG: Verru_Chthon cassette protein A [Verrucomicrobiota bacterium]